MAHTRGGGIGNMCGSDDRSLDELVAELRQRIKDDVYQSYAEISGDELERLIAELPGSRIAGLSALPFVLDVGSGP